MMNQTYNELVTRLHTLMKQWEASAKDAHTRANRADRHDYAEVYGQRARYQTLLQAARDVQALLQRPQEAVAETPPPAASEYAAVPRQDVEQLFRRARVKYSSLYEDAGYIYTVVFPNVLTNTAENRIAALQQVAPGLLILDQGKLEQTGEVYIDFAFDAPIEF